MFKKKSLAIFTVKNFIISDNIYYTYGGFGSYLSEISSYFKKVHLVAHVKAGNPPDGWYSVCHIKNLKIYHLLPSSNPLSFFLFLPHTILVSIKALRSVNIAHVRMPDFTGVVGGVLCILLDLPYFSQIIADWKLQRDNMMYSHKFYLGTLMKFYYTFYLYFEKFVSSKSIIFAQGRTCYTRLNKLNKCVFTISSAHSRSHIVNVKEKCYNSTIMLLTVGRLNRVKNQKLVLDAVKLLNDQKNNLTWNLTIIGSGPKFDYLNQYASRLNISNYVKFRGKVPYGNQLFAYFDDSDIFILPSLSEGTPKVLLESLARGLPVVASEVSGVPDTIKDRERGLLFNSNDLNDLVGCILLMYEDKTLREYCQKNGILFAQSNTVEEQTYSMLKDVKNYFNY
jgi:glycosyltransferase involved in cell wall biosynthesis